MNEEAAQELKQPSPPSKKRKVAVEKRVVRLRIGDDGKEKKNQGPCPPSDSWSWRKYGQKPIKGSPYPRGYYRCSTAKGCSAKKQVERCKSDASVLIVTYTSSHNHPERLFGSNTRNPKQTQQQQPPLIEQQQDESSQDQEEEAQDGTYRPTMEAEEEFHYSHVLQEGGELFEPSQFNLTGDNMSSGLVLLEQHQSAGHVLAMDRTSAKAEVEEEECYDFFDELEELYPTMGLFSHGLRDRHHHHQHQLVR